LSYRLLKAFIQVQYVTWSMAWWRQ